MYIYVYIYVYTYIYIYKLTFLTIVSNLSSSAVDSCIIKSQSLASGIMFVALEVSPKYTSFLPLIDGPVTSTDLIRVPSAKNTFLPSC
jgi:hypothetical protein